MARNPGLCYKTLFKSLDGKAPSNNIVKKIGATMKRTSQSFYKYKSINNFEFILDILLYERLYAGKYHELNDPMEGVIKLDGTIPEEEISEWEQSLKNYNICCFTKDPENNLMWSHYADGGKGCLIEFELDEDVSYSKITYGKTPIVKAKEIRQLTAHEVFLHKLKYWQYEKEYRAFSWEIAFFLLK